MSRGASATDAALHAQIARAQKLERGVLDGLTDEQCEAIVRQIRAYKEAQAQRQQLNRACPVFRETARQVFRPLFAEADALYWQVALSCPSLRGRALYHARRLRAELEDLLPEAQYGAWRAALRYSPSCGKSYQEFAFDWIRVACDNAKWRSLPVSIPRAMATRGDAPPPSACESLNVPVGTEDSLRTTRQDWLVDPVNAESRIETRLLLGKLEAMDLSPLEYALLETLTGDVQITEVWQRLQELGAPDRCRWATSLAQKRLLASIRKQWKVSL